MEQIDINKSLRSAIEEKITALVEVFFMQYGIKYTKHPSADRWMIRYFNFRVKYIPTITRHVYISKELCDKIVFSSVQPAIDALIKKMKSGNDLNPHQSRTSFNSDFHDDLFNDWGIHHLHLEVEKQAATDYFCKRTGPLLFAKITDEFVLLIDIQHHKDKNVWSNTDLIRIMQNTWPEYMERFQSKGKRWSPELDDESIGILRSKGYTFGINVDDKAYLMLGDGYSSSGVNSRAVGLANEVWRWVGKNRDRFAIDEKGFLGELKKQLFMD